MAKVVKHGWTHRPRSQGGTDPIEIEATAASGGLPTAIAVGGNGASRPTNAACAFSSVAWAVEHDDIFGLAVTSGSPPTQTAKYVTITPGTYRLETCVFWVFTQEFAPGENPYILPVVWYPGAASEDTVANSMPGPFFDDTQGGIWGTQEEAVSAEYNALIATQVFSWEEADFDESTIGLGVSLIESASLSTLNWGAHLAVTQLNPFKHVDRTSP